jgi:hypothetical protein
MFNYNEQIQAYESQMVSLPQAKRDQLRARRDANRNRLKQNRPEGIRLNDDHFIPQGSMAIQTTVQEKDDAYDIDDGVWFHADDLGNGDGEPKTARQVQEMVRDALQDPNFDKKPRIQGNCVRVFYAEGYHVDVPVYRKFNADAEQEKQELGGENGWTQSDPTEINRWFERRVQELNAYRDGSGSQLRKMVRLLKRFARSRDDEWDMPNGLKLTMLTEECFPAYYERDDEAFYWLLSKLKSRLDASLEVENRAQTKWPRDKLTKTANDSNMVELRERVSEGLGKLLVLHHPQCSLKQAREAWDWVFRSEGFFEALEKDAVKAATLFERATIINAGLAFTSPLGVVGSVGVPNVPHKFYGGELPKVKR